MRLTPALSLRFTLALLLAAPLLAQTPTVRLESPVPPPEWALLERALLRAASDGTAAFAAHYLDERDFLKCVERWGGNDGADDAMENFHGWTLLYALGGDDQVLADYQRAWEGHLTQFTEARAPGIEMAENGMYWREFVTSFDWEHTGEALAAFHVYSLTRPDDPHYRTRVRRFARFYTGDDPYADNYDRDKKIIKSIHNGSRGAKVTPASEMDWGGLPVEGDPERLTRYATASNIKGDHPLNLGTTALGYNAYLLTGEQRFRDWTLEYAGAWRDRIVDNGGNIPTNIGLNGEIGGEWGGKWYGGTFGWNFWPQSGGRNYFIRGPRIAMGLATLLTGDKSYLEALRLQIRNLYAAKKVENGQVLLPGKYGDDGWYGYSRNERLDVQRDLYLYTFDKTHLEGLDRDPWLRYLNGAAPDYPVRALRGEIESVRRRVQGLQADNMARDQRTSDHSQRFNPAEVDSLTQLTLGANPPGTSGNILHTRLLYYDPARRRVGLPEDVAALVESITPQGLKVRLVNLNPLEPRKVLVQAGAYREHRFGSIRGDAQAAVNGSLFQVELAPGAGGALEIGLELLANRPSLGMPWD
ncbi:MAG: hypothetical protein GC160_10250 [Acidobacteria bacterium]|nr:hypothetical protein [Acidobacteriota bacterium]